MRTRHFTDVEELSRPCRCKADAGAYRFGCLECGAACCSVCAITLESVAYCRHCATALLGAVVILKSGPFELY